MKLGLTNTIPNIVTLPGQGGGSGPAYGPEAFVTEWSVVAGQTIILPSFDGINPGVVNYDVDWGDGNSESGVTIDDKTHLYADTDTYTVVITGQFGALNMYRETGLYPNNPTSLVKMVQWGTDNVWSSMYAMFWGCTGMSYEAIDYPNLSALAESTSAQYMFRNCTSIISLDLTNWTNTSNFTNLGSAFQALNSCESFSINGWDLTGAATVTSCFREIGTTTASGCVADFSNLTFNSCTSFTYAWYLSYFSSIDMSGWDLGVANAAWGSAFDSMNYTGLLDLSGWTNIRATASMGYAFKAMNVTSINITGWDTSNVTSMYGLFYGSTSLQEIIGLNELSSTSLTNTGAQSMFQNCNVLSFSSAGSNLSDAFGTGLGACKYLNNMFSYVGSTTPGVAPNITNFDTTSAVGFTAMFQGCKFTTTIDITGWNVPDLENMSSMFYLSTLPTQTMDLSAWNFTSAMSTMSNSFRQQIGITSIKFDSANCDLSGVSTMSYFAYGNTSLSTIEFVGAADFTGVTNMIGFCQNAWNGITVDLGSVQDFSNVTFWNNSFYQMGPGVSINFLPGAIIPGTAFNAFLTSTTLATADYDNLLQALDANLSINGDLNGGILTKYNAAPAAGGAARDSLTVKGWVFTDGGPV